MVTKWARGGARTSKSPSPLPDPLLGNCNIHREETVEWEALNFHLDPKKMSKELQ